MQTKRIQRLAGILKAEISQIIHSRLKDPRVGFVTISRVMLSSDLKLAKVYFTLLGDAGKAKENEEALNRASSFIQSELGSRIRVRYMPALRFYFDETWEYEENIERLLHELHTKQDSSET